VRAWDMQTGVCLRRFRSHTDFVNSCHPARRGPDLVCSGSDDGTVQVYFILFTFYSTLVFPDTSAIIYHSTFLPVFLLYSTQIHDLRRREPVMSFENVNKFQITAVTFNDTAELVVSGGIDNALKVNL
jgi:Prp8 binding protein